MTAVLDPASRELYVLPLEGPLRVPISWDLTHKVWTLGWKGERNIVLDLAGVPSIDAAGVGQLIGAYNGMAAVDGALRIVRPHARVSEILRRVGVLELLSQTIF